MIPYSSASGKKSGVSAYGIGEDFIIVQFDTGQYKYSYSSCGRTATEKMKELAMASKGLSTFITQNQPGFEWKH